MKVTRDTPDQLIIENNPLWLAILVSLFGLTFLGIGLANFGSDPGTGAIFALCGLGIAVGFNMIFIRRTQLILDRSRQLVELRRRSWFGYSRMTWDLRHLSGAIVQTSRSGDTDTHRAALVFDGGMDAGTHPVTLVYSSGRGARRAKEAIDAWRARVDSTPSTD